MFDQGAGKDVNIATLIGPPTVGERIELYDLYVEAILFEKAFDLCQVEEFIAGPCVYTDPNRGELGFEIRA
ncbi:MAG: hypothetical protein OSB19_06160 [Opitutaceae bacterium]|nr:hypothetical protein [Opitutaceae bacterium]